MWSLPTLMEKGYQVCENYVWKSCKLKSIYRPVYSWAGKGRGDKIGILHGTAMSVCMQRCKNSKSEQFSFGTLWTCHVEFRGKQGNLSLITPKQICIWWRKTLRTTYIVDGIYIYFLKFRLRSLKIWKYTVLLCERQVKDNDVIVDSNYFCRIAFIIWIFIYGNIVAMKHFATSFLIRTAKEWNLKSIQ